VVTLDAALHHLERMIGVKLEWAELSDFLPADYTGPLRRSAIASSFLAALELARQGRVDLRQDAAFEPLYLKAASA
jgi:segregation and condensation protein A